LHPTYHQAATVAELRQLAGTIQNRVPDGMAPFLVQLWNDIVDRLEVEVPASHFLIGLVQVGLCSVPCCLLSCSGVSNSFSEKHKEGQRPILPTELLMCACLCRHHNPTPQWLANHNLSAMLAAYDASLQVGCRWVVNMRVGYQGSSLLLLALMGDLYGQGILRRLGVLIKPAPTH
jgi:hypothetical protein